MHYINLHTTLNSKTYIAKVSMYLAFFTNCYIPLALQIQTYWCWGVIRGLHDQEELVPTTKPEPLVIYLGLIILVHNS